jgi:hypothetical protein
MRWSLRLLPYQLWPNTTHGSKILVTEYRSAAAPRAHDRWAFAGRGPGSAGGDGNHNEQDRCDNPNAPAVTREAEEDWFKKPLSPQLFAYHIG